MTGIGRLLLTLGVLAAGTLAMTSVPAASGPDRSPVASAVTVASAVAATPTSVRVDQGSGGWVLRDSYGRELTLRGFNVSGSTKLRETGLLPFRSTADAATSAQAMRELTGANAIRFLIAWEGVQPAPGVVDTGYLDRAAAQLREFTDRGIRVLLDYHQDLHSAHLFDPDSWYTGDGAPAWVIEAGGYPDESCGICLLWGQNMLTNTAVRRAAYDFWHNRTLTTAAGQVRVQDAYLAQASATMRHLAARLPAGSLDMIIGVDPVNEPFDGGLDGATGAAWERTYLWPFYQRFRAAMDAAGWAAKPAFVEPLVFWNTGFGEQGGMTELPPLGPGYVFNAHFYDGARMVIDPTPAGDGTYAGAMNRIRDRATSLSTAPFVSEYGAALSGTGSDRTPWIIRAMYQGLDSRLSGAQFFANAGQAGAPLSATQWHWDTSSGRHAEPMNGNPDKVQTTGDAWNGEDHSVVAVDATGAVVPRLDRRVLDRLYPTAVAGQRLAFGYEDLARSGYAGAGRQQAWLSVPANMPAVAALVADRQFGVLAWREPATPAGAPTELHLPGSFPTAGTVLVGDVAALVGPPTAGSGAGGAVAVGLEPGSTTARRLLVDTAGSPAGSVHVLLVANAGNGRPVTAAQLAAARTELVAWATGAFG